MLREVPHDHGTGVRCLNPSDMCCRAAVVSGTSAPVGRLCGVSFVWLDELPLVPGPPDLRMGLRALDRSAWLLNDGLTEDELILKAELLDDHDDLVLLADGHEAAAAELLAHIEGHLGLPPSGLSGLAALDRASRLVPEDQCLMARVDGVWRLVGGSLVFPNQWRLVDKMGGTMLDIHGPTEGYEELLSTRVSSFFDRMTPYRIFGRRNWFFHDIADYHQPSAAEMRPITDPADAAGLFLRSERETLRLLPETGAVVFTIKTQIAPLAAVRERPAVAQQVVRYLAAATERGLRAKDAEGRSAAIMSYLSGSSGS